MCGDASRTSCVCVRVCVNGLGAGKGGWVGVPPDRSRTEPCAASGSCPTPLPQRWLARLRQSSLRPRSTEAHRTCGTSRSVIEQSHGSNRPCRSQGQQANRASEPSPSRLPGSPARPAIVITVFPARQIFLHDGCAMEELFRRFARRSRRRNGSRSRRRRRSRRSRRRGWGSCCFVAHLMVWFAKSATYTIGRSGSTAIPCVVRDANMGHQLAGENSSWCPELESRTTHVDAKAVTLKLSHRTLSWTLIKATNAEPRAQHAPGPRSGLHAEERGPVGSRTSCSNTHHLPPRHSQAAPPAASRPGLSRIAWPLYVSPDARTLPPPPCCLSTAPTSFLSCPHHLSGYRRATVGGAA